MKSICVLAGRWALIVLLSVVIMFPPVWAISTWGVERAEAQHRAVRPKLAPGQKDFGFGLRGLGALVAYTAGSFVVIWPLSLWASYRLLRNIGRTRRAPVAPIPAAAVPTDLVLTRGQVIGGVPAPSEGASDGILAARAEVAQSATRL